MLFLTNILYISQAWAQISFFIKILKDQMIKFSTEFVRVQIFYNTKGSSTKYRSDVTKGYQKGESILKC